MQIFMGKKYISTKEAAKRYGFSGRWFERERSMKRGPTFLRLNAKGRIFYPLDETDEWFKNNLKENI